MLAPTRIRVARGAGLFGAVLAAALLAGCGAPAPKAMVAKRAHSKEYFAESEYGVKASPRVSMLKSNLPRGGGRDQIGKPYQVRGKWYYPKEDRGYRKVGLASWYGDAFHGRLTANGEIYDKTHLTAAHPTMPLPSYARVTNAQTGSSVIVRVNDRGPYADGRIIDLSQRAAEMLDYQHHGTAKVVVEYVGRAPLDGNDDQYLMASYQPGNKPLDPSVGLPDGVMIAMNGRTPGGSSSLPGVREGNGAELLAAMGAKGDSADVPLPTFGPVAAERPSDDGFGNGVLMASAGLSYAEEAPAARSARAFAALQGEEAQNAEVYVAAGSYRDAAQARKIADRLSRYGRVEVSHDRMGGHVWHSVNVHPRGGASVDALLEAAWANGATDAFAVHD